MVAASVALTKHADHLQEQRTQNVAASVSTAVAAEVAGQAFSAIPNNKSFTTTSDNAESILVARKIGDIKGKDDCARFDVVRMNPGAMGGEGFANVVVCRPAGSALALDAPRP